MWRRFWSSGILKHSLSAAAVGRSAPPPSLLLGMGWAPIQQSGRARELVLLSKRVLMSTTSSSSQFFTTDAGDHSNSSKEGGGGGVVCKSMGIARSQDEAIEFARALMMPALSFSSGTRSISILTRYPYLLSFFSAQVVELVKRAMPLALTHEDDPVRIELKTLQERKEEIDILAHKQVQRILWCGLGLGLLQVGLFFRLTFWEFSWDVMEPIGFLSLPLRKLFKKQKFDVERFKELQKKCKTPLDATTSLKNRGLEVELEDAIHKD
ncbi:hypothetical protein GH714_043280 [Hevea brasiliensis]|uniref:Calcium uniporter protein C-terminal domain-containing protein n=1 Tax=Hevea brasiliensis TaxID=3981 RepID=A0A6A6K3L7_HEVBR|nr:hypothetical protein GH714_043280 [Hevea brasiliensis]